MTEQTGSKKPSLLPKVIVLTVLIVLIGAFFAFGGTEYLTLDYLKSQWINIAEFHQNNPTVALVLFFVVYVVVTGLSLPGAAILTLFAGAIFGFLTGVILVSFASTLGATIAFVIARFIFRDAILSKFSKQLQVIEEGVKKDGAFYLFALRLVPAFPFFVVNLVMSITPIKTWTFMWVSQVGMLAGTMVFVNAGAQVSQIDSLTVSGILTPQLIISFILLGIFPLVAKFVLNKIKARR